MSIHHRRLKLLELSIDAVQFECQLRSWKVNNDTDDGDTVYTFCPDGEDREEVDDAYSLELAFFADWRSGGISDFLWDNDGEVVDFQLDHHPDIPGEHVRWTGQLHVKAPSVGGEARTTEVTEVTLQIIGRPTKTRP